MDGSFKLGVEKRREKMKIKHSEKKRQEGLSVLFRYLFFMIIPLFLIPEYQK
jgi:hypothetical protein